MLNTMQLVQALEGFQDSWQRREIPSPSTVGQCLRKQWFMATGTQRTERVEASGILSFERGKAMQSLADAVLKRLGAAVSPNVKLPKEALDGIGCERGEVDGLAVYGGECWLLEVKVLGVWGYLSYYEKGLDESDPFDRVYVAQRQLYLLALSSLDFVPISGVLFVVFAADPTAVNWIATKIKKWPEPPPPLHVQVDALAPDFAGEMVTRARQVKALATSTKNPADVPRDYNPFKPDKPCNYCGFRQACENAG